MSLPNRLEPMIAGHDRNSGRGAGGLCDWKEARRRKNFEFSLNRPLWRVSALCYHRG